AAPPKKPVDPKVQNISMISLQRGNKAAGAKQFTDAIEFYRRAVASWDGNHLAWYGLGGAYAQEGDWKSAADAFEHARALSPTVPMYQMWSGIASYEATVQQARVDQAAQRNVKPEEVRPDLSRVVFDTARGYLDAAITLEPN